MDRCSVLVDWKNIAKKMSMPLKTNLRFYVITIKIPMAFFIGQSN